MLRRTQFQHYERQTEGDSYDELFRRSNTRHAMYGGIDTYI